LLSAHWIQCWPVCWKNMTYWHHFWLNSSTVPCRLVFSLRLSRQHTPPRCWRSLILIRPMSGHTGQYPTFPFSLSCSNDLLPVNYSSTWLLSSYFWSCNLHIELIIPRLHRLQRPHADPRRQDCIELFLGSASDPQSDSQQTFLTSLVVAMVLVWLDYGSATLAGLPDLLLGKLQSVLNAAAQLVCSGRQYDHVTPLLRDLHWLPFPERTTFRLAVLAYRCQHGLAPSYLSADIRVADADSRRRLRSTSTAELLVPRTRLSTVGDRAFPVAAVRAWNNLPPSVTSAPSLSTFTKRLKTELFSRCFLP